MEIRLPNFTWFINYLPEGAGSGTPFSGSLGTDPAVGFMKSKSFNYNVFLCRKEEGALEFLVESYTLPPWAPGISPQRGDEASELFAGSEEAIPEIESYLLGRARELL
ncbi:MAG: hypothetical protein E7559_08055 [Ruminococcaceae bacterium]|nr:hypothetical protein [Oscillospiraceae bacterium]